MERVVVLEDQSRVRNLVEKTNMTSVRVFGVVGCLVLTAQVWAASGERGALRKEIKADEMAVKSAKEALDTAETAAGLPLTFPHAEGEKKPAATEAPPHTTQTPAEHLAKALEHVNKELERVAKLEGQANLPSGVSSAAQTLVTALNKLKTDLTAVETTVGTK
jgi:hypothetical protein